MFLRTSFNHEAEEARQFYRLRGSDSRASNILGANDDAFDIGAAKIRFAEFSSGKVGSIQHRSREDRAF
jgi:hypothetical protein